MQVMLDWFPCIMESLLTFLRCLSLGHVCLSDYFLMTNILMWDYLMKVLESFKASDSHCQFTIKVVTVWDFPVAQMVKNLPAMRETWVQSLGWEDSPEKGKNYPLWYSGLENAMDCIVHGVTD